MPEPTDKTTAEPTAPAEAFRLPSARELQAAKAKRKEAAVSAGFAPGTVVGLPPGWVAAIIDLKLPPSRVGELRAKWEVLGWVKLEGKPTVTGYPLAEVWVKNRSDFDESRKERHDRQRELRRAGLIIATV